MLADIEFPEIEKHMEEKPVEEKPKEEFVMKSAKENQNNEKSQDKVDELQSFLSRSPSQEIDIAQLKKLVFDASPEQFNSHKTKLIGFLLEVLELFFFFLYL